MDRQDSLSGPKVEHAAPLRVAARLQAYGLTVVDAEAALETELPQACQRQQRGKAVRRHLCSNRARS